MANFSFSRRSVLGAGLLVPTLLLADGLNAGGEVIAATPMRCADLLATLGVNTHLRYAGSQYNAIDGVLAALDYCGFRHLRDTAISAQAPNADHYGRLAAAGKRFCLFWGTGRTMRDAIEQVSALEAAHPGAVEFLEGVNEIQPRFAYAGLTGIAAGQKFMADMKTDAEADPHLRSKPLVSFTSFAAASSVADFGNHHPYPKNGVQPGDLIHQRRDQWVGASGAMPGKPMVFTEFGYHTLVGKPARPGHWQGVDEDTQATLILNGLLDSATAGVSRCYIYQLLDGVLDKPGNPSQENHFGLFRFNGRPKPAATAIRNLVSLIGDTSPRARSFPLAPVPVHASAARPVRVLPLQDAGGGQFLVLWREDPVWDHERSLPTPVAPVTVSLGASRDMRFVASTIVDGQQVAANGPARNASVPVGARPVLVRFS